MVENTRLIELPLRSETIRGSGTGVRNEDEDKLSEDQEDQRESSRASVFKYTQNDTEKKR